MRAALARASAKSAMPEDGVQPVLKVAAIAKRGVLSSRRAKAAANSATLGSMQRMLPRRAAPIVLQARRRAARARASAWTVLPAAFRIMLLLPSAKIALVTSMLPEEPSSATNATNKKHGEQIQTIRFRYNFDKKMHCSLKPLC